MFERIKFFPVMIAMLVAFLGLKGLDLWTGTAVSLKAIGVAQAAEKKPHDDPAKDDHAPADEHEAKADDGHGAPDDGDHEPTNTGSGYLTAADVDIRNSIEERDAKLAAWEEELKVQRNMIAVAEKRVDEKIAIYTEMKQTLRDLMGQKTQEEEAELLRLVKVYETMKPKAAAPIMERLDDQTRLAIASRMKEVKLALILTYMDKDAAQALTRQLMQKTDLPVEFGLLPASLEGEEQNPGATGPDL